MAQNARTIYDERFQVVLDQHNTHPCIVWVGSKVSYGDKKTERCLLEARRSPSYDSIFSRNGFTEYLVITAFPRPATCFRVVYNERTDEVKIPACVLESDIWPHLLFFLQSEIPRYEKDPEQKPRWMVESESVSPD